jgi:hypothetical protein
MRAKEFLIERTLDNQPTGQPANQPAGQNDQVKNSIIQKIQSIADPKELNKIYSYVRKLDIGEGFEDIFTKDTDLRQVQRVLSNAIVESPGTFEEKLAFAKEMVTGEGIVSLEQLFTPGVKQSLTSIVKTKYPEIFDSVGNELLNIAGAFSAGGKKTNRGKGEFFLALASPKITLSKTAGDLNVNGRLVEVKGNQARIKGRKGYGSTDAAYTDVKKNISKFLKNYLPKNDQVDFKVGLGARSSFWNGEFGDYCSSNGIDEFSHIDKFLQEQLKLIVRSLYLDLSKNDLNEMLSCIDHGTLNFNRFTMINKRVAFNYYQQSDNFSGILFINSDKLTSVWCPDAETFQSTIKMGKLGYEPGQQNGMQIKL